MLKKAGVVAALILTLSSGAMAAADKTVVQESWEKFIPSTNFEYAKNHGKIELGGSAEVFFDHQWDALEEWDNGKVRLVYSPLNNVEVTGLLDGHRYVSFAVPTGNETDRIMQGAVKGKVYNANGFEVVVRGGVANLKNDVNFEGYVPEENATTAFFANLYTKKQINEHVALYNNVSASLENEKNIEGQEQSNEKSVNAGMTNGIEVMVNDKNTAKVSVQTDYDRNAKSFGTRVKAAVKSNVNSQTTNLFMVATPTDLSKIEAVNIVESNVKPDVLVRGHGDMTLEDTQTGYKVKGNVGVDAEKKIGIVTLKAGIRHNLEAKNWRVATLKGGIKVDVTKKLNLSLEAEKNKFYYPQTNGYNDITVKTSLKYDL